MAKKENITIGSDRFSALVSLLKAPVSGKIIEICRGYAFFLEGGVLRFGRNEEAQSDIKYSEEITQGSNPLPAFRSHLFLGIPERGKVSNINKKGLIISLAFDKIEGRLSVRHVGVGDRIRMYGMTKSVKKLLCDAGIPRSLRHSLPLLWDEKEILWIPFVGLCDKARDETAKMTVVVRLSGEVPDLIQQALQQSATPTEGL